MALKDRLRKLTTPIAELDQERLREFSASHEGVTAITDAEPRVEVLIAGEITSLRIVPRLDGSPWLEATITDGTGSLVAMWTGRRRIAGIRPGQRLLLEGRGAPTGPGGRLQITNPRYELLP